MTDFSNITKKLSKLRRFAVQDVPKIIGVEAVNHFTENFEKQSFNGTKWKDVKRRDSSSTWYGFQYGSKQRKPARHPSRRGVKRKYKPRKESPITNFAKHATRTPILSSQRSELENSIKFKTKGQRVIVYSDKPYAEIHNKGGKIKVFGGRSKKLPKRQFIGRDKRLEMQLQKRIRIEINKILG